MRPVFSSDVELEWGKLLDYYALRFQIEFNFRDAKQHFGLEDFMNTREAGVANASNLAFMMVLSRYAEVFQHNAETRTN